MLQGGPGDDVIEGGGGDDEDIQGNDGKDTINGGEGNDTISGGDKKDIIHGDGGNDTIWGGAGNDELYGDGGTDSINGGDDDDTIRGGDQGDNLSGSGGQDKIYGEDGDDTLNGHAGVDHLYGGPGSDTFDGRADTDWTYSEGTGPDDKDQPYDMVLPPGGIPGSPDMKGSGGADCDIEDGHEECPGLIVGINDEYSGTIGYGGTTNFPGTSEPNLLDNDWDSDDDPLTAVLYSQAEYGYVSLNEDGSFTYQPNDPADATADSFQYQAYDGENYSDPATVTLTLSNPPPVANDDSYGPTEFSYGGGIEFNLGSVLANDERVPANEDLIIDGHYTQPSDGSVTMDFEGFFTYTPNAGFVGTDSFTYQAYDHLNWGNSATVTITITNPSPVADDDAYAGGLDGSGEASFGSVLDNDSDPNDTWLEVADYSSASEGSVTVDPDGTIHYSAASPEFTGIVTFTYRTWDHWTYSDPATVTLTITSPLMLSAPPVENSTAASVDADAVRRFLVAAGERWHEAGVSRHIVGKALESLTVTVTDLPGSQLAGIHGSVIFVDHNAAGHGWFLDSTPADDAEFPRATTGGLRAGTNSPAYDHADLLTAVMHEMGHWFGLPHSDRPGNIMHEELDLGTRVNPSAVDAAIVEFIYSTRRRRN